MQISRSFSHWPFLTESQTMVTRSIRPMATRDRIRSLNNGTATTPRTIWRNIRRKGTRENGTHRRQNNHETLEYDFTSTMETHICTREEKNGKRQVPAFLRKRKFIFQYTTRRSFAYFHVHQSKYKTREILIRDARHGQW